MNQRTGEKVSWGWGSLERQLSRTLAARLHALSGQFALFLGEQPSGYSHGLCSQVQSIESRKCWSSHRLEMAVANDCLAGNVAAQRPVSGQDNHEA